MSDDGPGIPERPAGAHLRALHPRRRRADPARRRHRPRPGDLEIAGRAARRHDRGRVDPRRGLDLPLPPAGRRPQPAPSPGRGDRRGELMARVLVADDSETILLLMRTRLEMAGYEVETAADGQEVTERMHAATPGRPPDLLLLDAMMPRKSGHRRPARAARRRGRHPGADRQRPPGRERRRRPDRPRDQRLRHQADRLRAAARQHRRADPRLDRLSSWRSRAGSLCL